MEDVEGRHRKEGTALGATLPGVPNSEEVVAVPEEGQAVMLPWLLVPYPVMPPLLALKLVKWAGRVFEGRVAAAAAAPNRPTPTPIEAPGVVPSVPTPSPVLPSENSCPSPRSAFEKRAGVAPAGALSCALAGWRLNLACCRALLT